MKLCFLVEFSWAGRLGVEILIAILRSQGHHVSVVFDFQGTRPWGLPDASVAPRRLLAELLQERADVYLVSVVTDYFKRASGIAAALKRELPDAVVVFGGAHATYAWEGTINHSAVDYICRGEGDLALPALLRHLQNPSLPLPRGILRHDQDGIQGKGMGELVEDLDCLPFPDKSDLYAVSPMARDVYATVTGRGCPNRCSYCNSSTIRRHYRGHGERFLRRRSVDNVIAELVHAKQRWSPRYVAFFDDSFLADKPFVREFAARYKKEVGLPFSCLANPHASDISSLALLKDAGLTLVGVGVQTMDDMIRKEIFQRRESNQEVLEFMKSVRELGIYSQIDCIINPWDTRDGMIKQLYLYNEMRPSWINVFYLLLYPSTEILGIAQKDGKITAERKHAIESGELLGTYFFGGDVPRDVTESLKDISKFLTFIPLLPQPVVRRMIDTQVFRLFRWLPRRGILLVRALNSLCRKDDFWGRGNLKAFVQDLSQWLAETRNARRTQ